ncbi:hypothetical protein CULT_60097 [[Clostridium] ultunense Esp]|nr:hypothetical protein CULT_60097 [[Clostridium] ultunense Esp]
MGFRVGFPALTAHRPSLPKGVDCSARNLAVDSREWDLQVNREDYLISGHHLVELQDYPVLGHLPHQVRAMRVSAISLIF